ncbi:hypothetical protein [Nocardiopsis suaedae]|uniref:Uncharacterized protein n=1 Tax=Nocardiopsis suaedae TaxID=3018444 RepID=A0ABT4TTJ4_9ACTN|nr:hypothetical protein [Nocardiopsis suaedae]MDA2808007.1 hypothetical protein [Nocardiopsis suaedae]
MATIEQLLHRRNDLSTFLVHLSRDDDDSKTDARDNLLSILGARKIMAAKCFGEARELATQSEKIAATQRVVCFTETPP